MQDRRLQLVELTSDRLDRDQAAVLRRRFLNEHAYGGSSDHPALGLKDLRGLLRSPECDAVLLSEPAVTRQTSTLFQDAGPDVVLDRFNDSLVRGKS